MCLEEGMILWKRGMETDDTLPPFSNTKTDMVKTISDLDKTKSD